MRRSTSGTLEPVGIAIVVDDGRGLERAGKGFLRRSPCRVLDVRWREALARAHQRVEIDAFEDAGRHVAAPDRPSRFAIGKTDRDDVVEPSRTQECGIQSTDEVRRADQQTPLALAEFGHEFEQLVRDTLRG